MIKKTFESAAIPDVQNFFCKIVKLQKKFKQMKYP